MQSLITFVQEINRKIGVELPTTWQSLPDVEVARRFLAGINEYFFQTRDGIGTTEFRGEELQYFSEFHKFWEEHHAEILNIQIDQDQVRLAAASLANAVRRYGPEILAITHDIRGLQPRAVAQVRFFTANQDFREPPEEQYPKYLEDPTHFETATIEEDPADFLRFMGLTRLSQTDKRLDFARNAARFLQARNINAYQIAETFANNAVEIRQALTDESNNMGYASKKANMFIRDMVELGVWPGLSHYDEIDVASDANTMKVALRARILRPAIPLLSSFLDVFCSQYAYVDETSARAWRAVWEEWRARDPRTAPRSPCVMDFLLYSIGSDYCDDILVQYRCENGHTFYHFGGGLRRCRVCRVRAQVQITARLLPCQVQAQNLPREEGQLLLRGDNILRTFDGSCIFEGVCRPKNDGFTPYDPPKSISVKGRTGWTSSYSDRDRGGGGMMG